MNTAWDVRDDSLPLLDQLVKASRLLGADPGLVLHGGGNTSVKDTVIDATGRSLDVVFVKGSGWDLATIAPAGFAPLRRERLLQIAEVPNLDDKSLVNEMKQASLDAGAPTASIEAVLHALIPSAAVLHTHADAIVALTALEDASAVTDALGDDVLVIDYMKPGFGLARQIAETLEGLDVGSLRGIVLRNHGLFTFADTMGGAYTTHIDLVERARTFLRSKADYRPDNGPSAESSEAVDPLWLATLRKRVSDAAGRPMILTTRSSSAIERLLTSPGFPEISQRGPITPEHVIRTKRVPLVGDDVAAYVSEYEAYVSRNREKVAVSITPLDPAPRVILDPVAGLVTTGETVAATRIAADIYEHTAEVIVATENLGGYRTIDEADAFDIEYWDLEQAKLASGKRPPRFQGEVALVTGAASGIGFACAKALFDEGAAVIAVDLSESVASVVDDERWVGVVADVGDPDAVRNAVETGVRAFGGIDVVVPAAGIFAASAPIDALDPAAWHRSFRVNVDGLFYLFAAVKPYLAEAARGGRVTLIGSKNVQAPGPGASAYSASKAAATQLARVAALEWAGLGIRVNTVNPDAVFDTALWTDDLLAERAAKYGVSVQEYKLRNLLHTEVTSAHVGRVVADLSSVGYSATTGAQVPIDGGNDRVI